MRRQVRRGDRIEVKAYAMGELLASITDDSFTSIAQICWCHKNECYTEHYGESNIQIQIKNLTRGWEGIYNINAKKLL